MRWVLKCLSIRFRERDGVFLLKTRNLLFLERGMKNRGNSMIMSDCLIQKRIVQRMPATFDTKRIYELPVLKHNIAAVQLIFQTVFQESLSDSFLQKAIDHNKLLTKLSM